MHFWPKFGNTDFNLWWLIARTSSKWGKFWLLSSIWPRSSRSIIPKNNTDLNQGLLHLWSKFGDSSLNGWWVTARTSWWLTDRHTHTHTHTHAGNDNTRRPKLASGKNVHNIYLAPEQPHRDLSHSHRQSGTLYRQPRCKTLTAGRSDLCSDDRNKADLLELTKHILEKLDINISRRVGTSFPISTDKFTLYDLKGILNDYEEISHFLEWSIFWNLQNSQEHFNVTDIDIFVTLWCLCCFLCTKQTSMTHRHSGSMSAVFYQSISDI